MKEFKKELATYKAAVRKLPDNTAVQTLCAFEAVRAYQVFETVFWESKSDPVPPLKAEINRLAETLRGVDREYADAAFARRVKHQDKDAVDVRGGADADVKTLTGQLYSSLFTRFDDRHYFDEATDLLQQRIDRNGIGYDWLKGKKGLDAGCGGGRYTVALANLGAANVTGIDYGRDSIKDAKRRSKNARIDKVNFRHADVLNIPYKDNTFDFVFSNGVLHHTTDPFRGIQELCRVLKPGGKVWIFLYGKSLWWQMMDVLRPLSAKAPRERCQQVMQLMGYAPNRIFKFMDSLYVPIIESYSAVQMQRLLKRAGFTGGMQQLPRCVETPYFRGVNELLWDREPFAEARWGAGELRYLAEKPTK
jgi:ubiquinone/menaquinone biosynthesis C-methylase UbiE